MSKVTLLHKTAKICKNKEGETVYALGNTVASETRNLLSALPRAVTFIIRNRKDAEKMT